jgi:hypothetical protein
MSGSDEPSQMWQRCDIVCRREDGFKDTARVRLQALEVMARSLLPPRPTCKLDRDFYDECLDYWSKQQFMGNNLESPPASSEVSLSERVFSGSSLWTIFH